VERERIQVIQKAKKQATQKEEENGNTVVDSQEVVGPVPGDPEQKVNNVILVAVKEIKSLLVATVV
jgi:hypothetical protein